MSAQKDCLFCQMVAGSVSCTQVYEDERVLAFRDIAPQMPVHILVIPKNHYDNIADGVCSEDAAALVHAIGKIAEQEGIKESGFRVIANTNDDACQSVHHLHMHVLGGAPMNDGSPALQ